MDVDRLRLVEGAVPHVPTTDRMAMDRAWEEAVRANPSLFDGPVVACTDLASDGPRGAVITWVPTTFRHYSLRRGPTLSLPALFVAVVQPTGDGRVLVGRMSPSTSAPGRWQLPSGSAEPPADDLTALRRHAARELAEEVGVDTPSDDLTLWRIVRCGNGNVGVLFLASPRPVAQLRERFAALLSAEAALGRDPELDRIAFVGGSDLTKLAGPHIDYLAPVVRTHTA